MSSQVSDQVAAAPAHTLLGEGSHTRRELNPRQADTVARVLSAAHDELRSVGYDALTIRSVAARAGVAPATAYTYFGSKNHLVAELFARRMVEHVAELPFAAGEPADRDAAIERVVALIRALTDLLAAEPEIAHAVTPALLGTDADVQHLRLRIGTGWAAWFSSALGADRVAARPDVLDTTMLAVSGGLLQAGMGLMTYPQLGERLESAVRVIMEGVA